MRLLATQDLLENDVQRAVMAFYRNFDIEIARFSEGRRSRVQRGWPDLALFCLRKRAFWVHETKRTRGGIQSAAQHVIEEWCQQCDITYLLGGVQVAHDHLVKIGVLEP